MISSAIWDKSPQALFSKTYQTARARRTSAICGLCGLTSACLSQIAR